MLNFYSANVRIASTERAITECLKKAFGASTPPDLQLIVVYATLGHKLKKINDILKDQLPGVAVLGASCGGVIGPEGPGESMNELAVFAISGPADELAIGTIHDVFPDNSEEKATELAGMLKSANANINALFITVPGLDCACDSVVAGFDKVIGETIPIFGGVSSDNMKNITSYQLSEDTVREHSIWAVGLADPTIGTVSRATHGFDVIGEPFTITKTEGLRIQEIDGINAFQAYAQRFKLTEEAGISEVMPFGALAELLPKELWEEYGSPYILHGIIGKTDEGELLYRNHFKAGTELRLAIRDEALIFSEMKRILAEMCEAIDGEVLAVLQADCIARGRFSLNAIMKDELIGLMQDALVDDAGKVPAWLGMYGFGEFAMLGGKNRNHTFTSSLMALYRKNTAK